MLEMAERSDGCNGETLLAPCTRKKRLQRKMTKDCYWIGAEEIISMLSKSCNDHNNKKLLDETESNIQFIACGRGNIGRSEAEPNIILYGCNELDVGRGQVQ